MSETEHVHHHHSHHHHHSGSSSGSSSTSTSQHLPGGDSYSLRTFGKVTQTTRILPEGTLSVAVFSALVTALILAPVIVSLLFRNKALNERIDTLRDEMGKMIANAERQGAVVAPDQTSRARRVVTEEAPREQTPPRVAERTSNPPLSTRMIDVDAIADAVNMSKNEIAQIKNSMMLLPDGMRREKDKNGVETLSSDAFYTSLHNAYNYMALGQKHDAAGIFGMICGEMPQWPYSHFFLALANRDQAEMTKANALFTTARALNAQTVESELYGALSSLFLKSNVAAEIVISRLADTHDGKEELHMGPVFVPKTAPDDVLRMLRKVRGIGEIREIEW